MNNKEDQSVFFTVVKRKKEEKTNNKTPLNHRHARSRRNRMRQCI